MPTEPTAAGSVSTSDRGREADTAAVAATGALLGAAVPAGTTELGIDIIKVDRIRASLARFGERFSKRVLTAHEQRYVRARPETFAGRWAAKEAVSKVLGLGVRGIGWRDIEIERLPTGQPAVRLHGRAAARAEQLGMDRIAVSITHESDYAVAIAFGVRTAGGRYVFPPDIEARLDDRQVPAPTVRPQGRPHRERTAPPRHLRAEVSPVRLRIVERRQVRRARAEHARL